MIVDICGTKYVIPNMFRRMSETEDVGKYISEHGYEYNFINDNKGTRFEVEIGGKLFTVPAKRFEDIKDLAEEATIEAFHYKSMKASAFIAKMRRKYNCNPYWLWDFIEENFNIIKGLNGVIYEDEAAEAEEMIKRSLENPNY